MSQHFTFHVPFSSGKVDRQNGIIRGVSLMTGGITAIGHDLEVDDTTLKQVVTCAMKATGGQIPVKLNHGSGIENLCGYIDASSVVLEGSKVRGDWHLLKSHEEYNKLMERAETMPSCFGLSAAFKGGGMPVKGGKKAARCEQLLAVDCVTAPAANPDGLFSAKVDKAGNRMADNITTEPTLADLLAAVNGLAQRIEAQEQNINSLLDGQPQGDPDIAELLALANMSDEELEAQGIDVAKLNAALAKAEQDGLIEADGGTDDGAGDDGQGDLAGAGAGAPAGAGAGTGFSAKKVQALIQFEIGKVQRQARDAAQAAEAEHAFAVIQDKVTELAAVNDELVTELAAKNAEISSLKLTLRTTGNHVGSAGGSRETLFSVKGAKPGTYEALVQAKFTELKAGGKLSDVQAKSQAVQFCARNHRLEFEDYRKRGGRIEFAQQ